MRVFGRALLLGFLVAVFAPAGATAAPFLLDSSGLTDNGDPCAGVVDSIGTPECSWFAINDLSRPLSFTGGFNTTGDMALFSFTLTGDTRLQIETTSFRDPVNSFDPTLALYHPDGSIMTVPDPAGSGQPITANQFDISLDLGIYDDRIDLVLGQGNYLLALVTGFAYESLQTPIDGGDLSLGSAFSFTFNAAPEDGGPAPVPEPGTLTLMAGGAIAGLLQRRRSRKRHTHSSAVSR